MKIFKSVVNIIKRMLNNGFSIKGALDDERFFIRENAKYNEYIKMYQDKINHCFALSIQTYDIDDKTGLDIIFYSHDKKVIFNLFKNKETTTKQQFQSKEVDVVEIKDLSLITDEKILNLRETLNVILSPLTKLAFKKQDILLMLNDPNVKALLDDFNVNQDLFFEHAQTAISHL